MHALLRERRTRVTPYASPSVTRSSKERSVSEVCLVTICAYMPLRDQGWLFEVEVNAGEGSAQLRLPATNSDEAILLEMCLRQFEVNMSS